jgi:hypothetical protein
LQELEDDPDRGLENDELASFALIAARAELAAKSIQKVDALVSWLQENFTPQQFRSPLEPISTMNGSGHVVSKVRRVGWLISHVSDATQSKFE